MDWLDLPSQIFELLELEIVRRKKLLRRRSYGVFISALASHRSCFCRVPLVRGCSSSLLVDLQEGRLFALAFVADSSSAGEVHRALDRRLFGMEGRSGAEVLAYPIFIED